MRGLEAGGGPGDARGLFGAHRGAVVGASGVVEDEHGQVVLVPRSLSRSPDRSSKPQRSENENDYENENDFASWAAAMQPAGE